MISNRVLVTGVAGLLGSHLAEFLVKHGYSVIGIDNLSGGYMENVPAGVKFYQTDLLDDVDVDSIVHDNNVDFIYHFAAYSFFLV